MYICQTLSVDKMMDLLLKLMIKQGGAGSISTLRSVADRLMNLGNYIKPAFINRKSPSSNRIYMQSTQHNFRGCYVIRLHCDCSETDGCSASAGRARDEGRADRRAAAAGTLG